MAMSLTMLFSSYACNGGGGGESGGTPPLNPPSATDKVLDNSLFVNPSLEYRPMIMMHSPVSNIVDDAYDRGYGGIVTNVAWDSSYLQNARAFSTLYSVVSHAIDDKGMYVWLYDEYGYPSGAAYGLTLKGNPEYEALGLVPSYQLVPAGSTATIELYYGHKEIVAAYCYEANGANSADLSTAQDISNLISADKTTVTYKNNSSTDKYVAAFMSKRWYEFTHSMENWYAQQRYINMLEPEPSQKFIELTYDAYYDCLAEYFGKGIQAFFTDEPAHQGSYFNVSERDRQVIDVPDLNVPIIESLNYSESLFEVFEQTYGYDLKPLLGYMYVDDGSAKAKQVRMDFYLLTSSLFRQNYIGAIADWCEDKGVKSSGHLLLEETLYQNPWFAGNMIQLLGSMGIPGTDLLFSKPQNAMKASCIVSKMAASAADFEGKDQTFAEVSGAFDGTAGDIYDQINSIGVQFCMGVNNIASYYYQGGDHTVAEDKLFTDALGRMKYMTEGVTHDSSVVVYYPYEGVSAETLPSRNMYEPTASAKEISDAFTDMCVTLTQKQIDYDLVDYINLDKCRVEGNELVAPNGERYSTIVLSYTTALHSKAVSKLYEAAQAGVKIVMENFESVVCETGSSAADKFTAVYNAAEKVNSAVGAAKILRKSASVVLNDEYASTVYVSKRANANYALYTVVNAAEDKKQYTFTFDEVGESVYYYDTLTGDITKVSAKTEGGKTTCTYTLPKNTTGFFVIYK